MKTNFIFICDSISKNNGKFNVEGIFDSVSSKGFPAKHSALILVVNLEILEEEQNKSYLESFKILFENRTVIEDSTTFKPYLSISSAIGVFGNNDILLN